MYIFASIAELFWCFFCGFSLDINFRCYFNRVFAVILYDFSVDQRNRVMRLQLTQLIALFSSQFCDASISFRFIRTHRTKNTFGWLYELPVLCVCTLCIHLVFCLNFCVFFSLGFFASLYAMRPFFGECFPSKHVSVWWGSDSSMSVELTALFGVNCYVLSVAFIYILQNCVANKSANRKLCILVNWLGRLLQFSASEIVNNLLNKMNQN